EDPHWIEQDRWHVNLASRVLDRLAGVLLLALRERNGKPRRRVGFLLYGLVDRHALVADQDVLQALYRGVLSGHRHLAVELELLQHGDGRVAEAVVCREYARDVGLAGQHLLEDGRG